MIASGSKKASISFQKMLLKQILSAAFAFANSCYAACNVAVDASIAASRGLAARQQQQREKIQGLGSWNYYLHEVALGFY